ncbi:efflux RND transporter periplasmic adaptor subunit [Myxococcota bacterium]|nr:efflux RND transporter periplasmic adaptor subunit [Myxococcota bacterium]
MRTQLADEKVLEGSSGLDVGPTFLHLLVALGVLCLTLGCERPKAPAPTLLEIPVAQVLVRDQPILRELVGETRGSSDILIRARVEGVLTGMHFREGSHVKKGGLLYEIDPTPFEAQVVGAQGKVAETVTRLAKAESDLDRIAPLAEINAVSQADLDGAVARYQAAKGALQTAQASVEQARIQLGYTKLHAPISGRIGISKARVGEFVGRTPNPVVLNVVSDTNPIKVRFSIDERTYLLLAKRLAQAGKGSGEQKRLAAGLELILADGSVHPEKGHVVAMDAVVDSGMGTLTLEAEFPNPEQRVLAGQFARIRVVAEVLEGAMLIPSRSISDMQGKKRVYVVDDKGKVSIRSVELGPEVGTLRVITQGLKPNERIAVDAIRLRPGMTIDPKPVAANPTDVKEPGAKPAPAAGA